MTQDVNDDVQRATDEMSASERETGLKTVKYFLEYNVTGSWHRFGGVGIMFLDQALGALKSARETASQAETAVLKLYAPERHVRWRLTQQITYTLVLDE